MRSERPGRTSCCTSPPSPSCASRISTRARPSRPTSTARSTCSRRSREPRQEGALIVTTDKVYANVGQRIGYVESDALGGDDPYSASKAMADLPTRWTTSFPGVPAAIARAGNVIGGGDVSKDRLLSDLLGGQLGPTR